MSEWLKYVEITPHPRGVISNKAAVSAMVYALEILKVGPFILDDVPSELKPAEILGCEEYVTFLDETLSTVHLVLPILKVWTRYGLLWVVWVKHELKINTPVRKSKTRFPNVSVLKYREIPQVILKTLC